MLATGLSALSRVNYLHNEQHLVTIQTRLAATTLAAAPIDVQRRLGRPVSLTSVTSDPAQFSSAIATSMTSAGPFTSALLYRVVDGTPTLQVSLGTPTMLAPSSPEATALVQRAVSTGTLLVVRRTSGSEQRIGYALLEKGSGGTYVGYAEQVLPSDRRATIPKTSPLADVDFALYFGATQTSSALLETNASHLPLKGIKSSTPVPFGDGTLTLTVSPRHSLLGRFAESVAWAILIGGLLFTLGVAFLAERLVRRRIVAEQLAAANRQLYQAQRSVAETLQHSLLPQRLADPPELELAVRYLPGTEGIDVGGDWYDVVAVDERHVFFTVGDVSGRGLQAAILMSALRNAIDAYARDADPPGEVLAKVSRLIDVARDGRFATVVCGTIDLDSRAVVMANAGHPTPVLVDRDGGTLLHGPVGAPLGIGEVYVEQRFVLPADAVLLAYTDGLIERRGESITAGLERLCATVEYGERLDPMLDHLLAAIIPAGPSDDVAVLGIRWQS